MYAVKRKGVQVKGSIWIITFAAFVALIAMIVFSSDIYAQSTGQVHLQQESVQNFYEETFPQGSSYIIPSASDAVRVSVTVLDNLSLHLENGQPKYATNWKFGATVHIERVSPTEIAYTATADY